MIKNIHIYRHYFFSDKAKFELCAQLQELPQINDMTELAAPLVEKIGGKLGLYYTAWFDPFNLEIVRQYFINLGYEVSFSDEYEKDYKLHKLITNQ